MLGVVLCGSAVFLAASAPVAHAADQTAACTSTVGPGIPPPSSLPSGLPGFHAAWYGQSGYPTLCPGERSTATVAYYNSGSFGWVKGRMGEMAFLGTSNPVPGHDQASLLGGDGQLGSPATGWPRYNRIAAQPADYVGPGQVAWFQFTIQAPTTPGSYLLYLRPVIEGATWMEDYGVFWLVTVKDAGAGELDKCHAHERGRRRGRNDPRVQRDRQRRAHMRRPGVRRRTWSATSRAGSTRTRVVRPYSPRPRRS